MSARYIVVVMLDSLRPDFIKALSDKKISTPNIDKLILEGVTFTNAYAEYPITMPSRTAFLSGCYTFTNRPWCPMRSYDIHIAEHLQAAGYTTAAISDSAPFQKESCGKGFQEFEFLPVGKCHPPVESHYVPKTVDAYFPPNKRQEVFFLTNTLANRKYAYDKYGKACPDLLFDRAVDWLENKGKQKEKFFLWIDSFEPHEPWCPETPYDKMYQPDYQGRYIPMPVGPESTWMSEEELQHVRDLYKGDITNTDRQVGKIVKCLTELGIIDDTLLIILSDHGEPFGEHGTIRKFLVPVYDELAKIVWIMHCPSRLPMGKRINALVDNTDFAPTLFDLLGLPYPKDPKGRLSGWQDITTQKREGFEGVSAMPTISGKRVRDYVYCGAFALHSSIRGERWKFIDNEGEKENELYDMENDPYEKKNVIEKESEVARRLHRKLWEFKSQWGIPLSWRDKPAEK